jgi:hypothetical protein
MNKLVYKILVKNANEVMVYMADGRNIKFTGVDAVKQAITYLREVDAWEINLKTA